MLKSISGNSGRFGIDHLDSDGPSYPDRTFFLEAAGVWEVRVAIALSSMVIGLGVAVLAGALWRADRRDR